VHRWLSEEIDKATKNTAEWLAKECADIEVRSTVRENITSARLSARMSFGHWEEYEQLWREKGYRDLEKEELWTVGDDSQVKSRVELYLNLAKIEALRALEYVERLPSERANEGLILSYKNDFAYHLATEKDVKSKGRALELAYELRDKAQGNFHYLETFAWVLMRFAEKDSPEEGQREFAEGKAQVQELLKREDINKEHPSWRQKIKEKYELCFPGIGLPDIHG
jgi:hypothetical protein